jgi:hypothetical protein
METRLEREPLPVGFHKSFSRKDPFRLSVQASYNSLIASEYLYSPICPAQGGESLSTKQDVINLKMR